MLLTYFKDLSLDSKEHICVTEQVIKQYGEAMLLNKLTLLVIATENM